MTTGDTANPHSVSSSSESEGQQEGGQETQHENGSADSQEAPGSLTPSDRELLQKMNGSVEQLIRQAGDINRISKERERIIDRLHEENQQLRSGQIEQIIEPLIRDLVRLFDDLQHTIRTRVDAGDAEGLKDIEFFRETVSDILFRYGIDRYEEPQDLLFDPTVHRPLAAVPTNDPEQHRKIARVVRSGFRTEKRIVRMLEVDVFRYDEVKQQDGEDGHEARDENE